MELCAGLQATGAGDAYSDSKQADTNDSQPTAAVNLAVAFAKILESKPEEYYFSLIAF